MSSISAKLCPWWPRYRITPGSRLPQRVAVTSPSRALIPVVVAMLLPLSSAQRLAPEPRCATMRQGGEDRRANAAQERLIMLHVLLSARPELAIFAALVVGYAVGAIKLGPFQLGGVAGTLLAALVIGQVGVPIDPSLQRFMFTLFIYALGFSVAPQFFASIDRTTWTWGLLVVIEVVLIVAVAFFAAWLFALDVGTASGLLAGSATQIRHGGYRERSHRQTGPHGGGDKDVSR